MRYPSNKIIRIFLAVSAVILSVGLAYPLFASVSFPSTIVVPGANTFQIADSDFLQGGHMQFTATSSAVGLALRNAITPERRSTGMLVTINVSPTGTSTQGSTTYRLVSNRPSGIASDNSLTGCATSSSQMVTDGSLDGKPSGVPVGSQYACPVLSDMNWVVVIPTLNSANVNQFLQVQVDSNGNYVVGLGTASSSSASSTGGTVTSITAGNGLTGGTITATGTIALDLNHSNTWLSTQIFAGNATSTNNAISIGNGAFDGVSLGHFTGSSTQLAVNATSTFVGNLANLEIAGASKFKIDYLGNITAAGNAYIAGNLQVGGLAGSGGCLTSDSSGNIGVAACGGSTSIGSAISGGVPNQALYVNGSGNLAQSPDFQFNNSGYTSINGLLSIGDGPFDGGSSGYFNGNGNGTQLAINATSGFAGDLIDLQTAGASMFSVDATGLTTINNGNFVFNNNAGFPLFNVGDFLGSGNGTQLTLDDANQFVHVSGSQFTNPSNGLLSVGDGPFDGFTSGAFNGNPLGTEFAINAQGPTSGKKGITPGFQGNLADFQYNGTSVFNIDRNGATNIAAGSFSVASDGSFVAAGGGNFGVNSDGSFYASYGGNFNVDASGNIYSNPLSGGGCLDANSSGIIELTSCPSGTLAIGSTIGSATPNLVLYADASGNLAQSPNFSFNTSGYTPINGLLSIGDGPFDGGSSGYFNGNGNGTQLAINATSTFLGDLIDLQQAGTSMFSVDYTGNVNIAQGNFYINNDGSFYAANGGNFQVDASGDIITSGNLNVQGTATFNSLVSGGTNCVTANSSGTLGITPCGGGSSGMTLGGSIGGAAPNEVLYADASGNLAQDSNFSYVSGSLGIGTASPASALDVEGTLTLVRHTGFPSISTGVSNRLTVNESSGPPSDAGMDVQFSSGSSANNMTFIYSKTFVHSSFFGDNGSADIIGTEGSTPISFKNGLVYTSSNILGSGTEVMRITASGGLSLGSSYVSSDPGAGSMIISGNLGIGTTSPVSLLNVVGAPSATGTRGLLSLGNGGFTGATSTFLGSASGTELAINATSTYTGDLLNLEIGGSSKFKVDAAGNLTLSSLTAGGCLSAATSGRIQIGTCGATIGATLAGGSPNQVLFTNASSTLSQSANFAFANGTNPSLSVGDVLNAGNGTQLTLNDATSLVKIGGARPAGSSTVVFTPAATNEITDNNLTTAGPYTGPIANAVFTVTVNGSNEIYFIATSTGFSIGNTITVISGPASGTRAIVSSVGGTNMNVSQVVHVGNTGGPNTGSIITNGTATTTLTSGAGGSANTYTWTDGTNSGSGTMSSTATSSLINGVSIGFLSDIFGHSYGDTWTLNYLPNGTMESLNGVAHTYKIGDVDGVYNGAVFTVGASASTLSNSSFTVSGTLAATSTNALVSIGDGKFDAVSVGKFNGSALGTQFAINSALGFTGNLLDLQTAGVSRFKVDAAGNTTLTNLFANTTPAASTSTAVINIGNGTFGGGTGSFLGSATGTELAINATSTYTGDLANFEVGGVSKLAVDSIGNLTLNGNVYSKGTSWTSRSLPVTLSGQPFQSVAYGNGEFVAVTFAVGSASNIMTSPDGVNWTVRTNPLPTGFRTVTYGNGLFVAVGQGTDTTSALTSPDGITWTARTMPSNVNWMGVTYGNGLFVAVAQDGSTSTQFATSPDGITWTNRVSPSPRVWWNIAYGNGLFVALASDGATSTQIATSPDGITWTSRVSPSLRQWWGLVYGNGIFVATAIDGTASNQVMTSSDGITWTSRTIPVAGSYRGLTYGNGMFVAVPNTISSNVITSPDGITWTTHPTSDSTKTWNGVTYGNGMFVAVSGTSGLVMTSGTPETSTVQNNNIYQGGITVRGNSNFLGVISATTTTGIVNIGNGNFGSGAGLFTGSATGTQLAINAAAGFGGDLLNLQVAGSQKYRIDSLGNETVAGNITAGGGDFAFVGAATSTTFNVGDLLATGNRTKITLTDITSEIIARAKTFTVTDNGISGNTFLKIDTATSGVISLGDSSGVHGNGVFSITGSSTAGFWEADITDSSGGPYFRVNPGSGTYTLGSFGSGRGNNTGLYINDNIANDGTLAAKSAMIVADNSFGVVDTSGQNYFLADAANRVYKLGDINGATLGGNAGNGTHLSINDNTGVQSIFLRSNSVSATSTYGLVGIGDGVFGSTSTARFIGSATGTELAINATSTFTGDLANFEVGGVSKFAVSSAGNLTIAGNFYAKGVTWTGRTSPSSQWTAVAYGNGMYVAVSHDASTSTQIMTSPDGINWTGRVSPTNRTWESITYGNGLFVALNSSGGTSTSIMTSPDGINWTTSVTPSISGLHTVTYGNGLFVALGNGANGVMTSPDGINWTQHASASSRTWESVTYGNGKFVAVAYDGTTTNDIMTSPDGITWTSRTSPIANQWLDVTYGNGLFVAVSINGTATSDVMTSPDGITWTSQTSTAPNQWYGVTYGNGLFVAVANGPSTSSRVMTSPDGINWTARNTSLLNSFWQAVTYGNGQFVAVAFQGSVMTSGSPETETVQNNNTYQGGFTIYGNTNLLSLAVATSTYGTLNIGSGGFTGALNNFLGSATGTQIAINATSTFAGNLVDLQVAGSSKFSVDASGNITDAAYTQGSIPFAGSSGLISQDNAHFAFDAANLALGIGTSPVGGNALTVRSKSTTETITSGDTSQLSIDPTSPYTGSAGTVTVTNKTISVSLLGGTLTTAILGHYYSDSFPSGGHCTFSAVTGGPQFAMQLAGTSTAGWSYPIGATVYDYSTASDCSGTPIASSTVHIISYNQYALTGAITGLGTASSTYAYITGSSGTSNGLKVKFANPLGNYFGETWTINVNSSGVPANVLTLQSSTGNTVFNVNGSGIITSYNTTGSSTYLDIDPVGDTYSLGDISGAHNGTYLTINDSATATSGTVTIWNGNLIVHGTSGATCILGDGTGGTTCSSDQRLKQNVTDLHSALAEINQLRPVTYNWIDPRYADANNIGFIAQEMQRVYPEFVNVVDPKTGYLGINYAGLVTPIVKAIQEIDIKLEPLTSIDPNQDGSLASLIRSYLANALNGIQDIFAARVQTKELCIDDVCVTKTELQQVLNQANVQSAIIGPVQGIPNNGNGLEAGAASSPAANGDASATSTATSTDAGAPVDSSSTGTSTTEAPATDGGAATSTTDGSSVDVIDAGSASNPPAPDASAPTVPDSTSTATSSQ